MKDREEKGVMSNIQVSCDRGNCTVRLILPEGFEYYKKALAEDGGVFEENIIEDTNVTPCPEGYSYIVKNQKSIKEYLSEEAPDFLELLHLLLQCIIELGNVCKKYNISPCAMIYDYSAVFVSDSMREVKFLYMPGAEHVQKIMQCTELIKIIFLHIYDEISVEDYQTINDLLESNPEIKLADLMKTVNRVDEIVALYLEERKKSAKDKFRGWLQNKAVFEHKQKNRERLKAVKGKKQTKGVVEIIGERNLSGIHIQKSIFKDSEKIIRIGRDRKWSDIVVNDLTASRRHAELSFSSNRGLKVRDLSLNGTNVNGTKLRGYEKMYRLDSDVKILITEECEVLVRYKNA